MAIPALIVRSGDRSLAFHSRMLTAWAILMLASAGGFEVRPALADDAAQSATHAQERLIKVVNGNSREKLTTFAVDRQGRIIAGVAAIAVIAIVCGVLLASGGGTEAKPVLIMPTANRLNQA